MAIPARIVDTDSPRGTCLQGALMQRWQHTGRLVHQRWVFDLRWSSAPVGGPGRGRSREKPQIQLWRLRLWT